MYGLRGNIKKIKIDLPMKNQQSMFTDLDLHTCVDFSPLNKVVFDKLILLDKKNSPNVKHIEFIIDDDYNLHRCAMILIYLINIRNNISHIEWFKIAWINIKPHDIGSNSNHIQPSSEEHEIFHQNKNGNSIDDNELEYSVNDKIIKCTNCDLSIESLGILYATLIDWFQKLEAKCGINKNSVMNTVLRIYPKIKLHC